MSTTIQITYADLEAALGWSSSGGQGENEALICLAHSSRPAQVYYRSAYGDEPEPLPDDIDDESLYLAVPHQNELNLGRDLIFRFVETQAPQIESQVKAAFRQRGAYSKFKSAVDRAGLLAQWFAFEAAETRTALTSWAEENGLVVVEAAPGQV